MLGSPLCNGRFIHSCGKNFGCRGTRANCGFQPLTLWRKSFKYIVMCAQCIEELNERNLRFSTKYSRRKHHYSDTSLFAEQLKNKSQTNKLPIHRQISNTCLKLLRVVELSLIPRNSLFAHEIIHQFDVSSRLQHSILRSTTIEDSSPWLSFLAPSFRTCQRCSFF